MLIKLNPVGGGGVLIVDNVDIASDAEMFKVLADILTQLPISCFYPC